MTTIWLYKVLFVTHISITYVVVEAVAPCIRDQRWIDFIIKELCGQLHGSTLVNQDNRRTMSRINHVSDLHAMKNACLQYFFVLEAVKYKVLTDKTFH